MSYKSYIVYKYFYIHMSLWLQVLLYPFISLYPHFTHTLRNYYMIYMSLYTLYLGIISKINSNIRENL